MKNLKKMAREQLKELKGGALPGMKKCLDPVTCATKIWYAAVALDSPCTPSVPLCLTDLNPPIE